MQAYAKLQMRTEEKDMSYNIAFQATVSDRKSCVKHRKCWMQQEKNMVLN